MRRRFSTPPTSILPGSTTWPLMRMAMLMGVVVLMYMWAKDPRNWSWLQAMSSTSAVADKEKSAATEKPVPSKTVVPGPTDQDAAELVEASKQLEAVSDKTALALSEMPAYYRMMRWSQAQSFADLERRAQRNVRYAQLFEESDKYRGKLILIRLHIRRVLRHPAPEKNSANLKQVYEAWGFTDDSKSFPYVVVFNELPPRMKVGDELAEEGLFAGYFLKTMAYDAFDARRAAPLLVGRMSYIAASGGDSTAAGRPLSMGLQTIWVLAVIAVLAVIFALAMRSRLSRSRKRTSIPASTLSDEELAEWLNRQTEAPVETRSAERGARS